MASFIKKICELNSKKLRLKVPFDKLEPKHLANFIQCDHITCAQYYNQIIWKLFIHCVWKII